MVIIQIIPCGKLQLPSLISGVSRAPCNEVCAHWEKTTEITTLLIAMTVWNTGEAVISPKSQGIGISYGLVNWPSAILRSI